MKRASRIAVIAAVAAAGCGSPSVPGDPPAERGTVFEPLVETLDRAAGVQQTVDDRAADLRRRIQEAEDARE